MPRIEQVVTIAAPVADCFALSMSQGEVRYEWDPFVNRQWLLNGATKPAKGVQSLTRSRHRLTMITEYTAFNPPTQVGMKLVKGPPFFSMFGGGWSFKEIDELTTQATWRYTFKIRPEWLSRVADPIGNWLLNKDMARRIEHFAVGCTNEALVVRAKIQLAG